jgi:hypothetical protein
MQFESMALIQGIAQAAGQTSKFRHQTPNAANPATQIPLTQGICRVVVRAKPDGGGRPLHSEAR